MFDEALVRTLLESHAVNKSYFYAGLYSPNVSREMMPKLVPVISADAAHCSGLSKGTLVSLFGADVNHRQVILAIMVVGDNQIAETWSIFLQFANKSLKFNWKCVKIITDQQKGVRNAIGIHLPGAKQFLCTMHRKTNVYKNCDGVTGQAFVCAVKTYTHKELQCAKDKYRPAGRFYMEKWIENEQYPLICGYLQGVKTSQGAEAMDNALKKVHTAPSAAT